MVDSGDGYSEAKNWVAGTRDPLCGDHISARVII